MAATACTPAQQKWAWRQSVLRCGSAWCRQPRARHVLRCTLCELMCRGSVRAGLRRPGERRDHATACVRSPAPQPGPWLAPAVRPGQGVSHRPFCRRGGGRSLAAASREGVTDAEACSPSQQSVDSQSCSRRRGCRLTGRPSTAPEAWAACADAAGTPSRAQARRDKDSVDSGATAAKRLRLGALGGCDRCGGAGAVPAASFKLVGTLERRVWAGLEGNSVDAGACAACSGGAGGMQPLRTRQGVLAVRDYKHAPVANRSRRRAALLSVGFPS